MKKAIIFGVFILLLFFTFIKIAASPSVAQKTTPSLSLMIDPPARFGPVNSQFTVKLVMQSTENISSGTVNISFPQALLSDNDITFIESPTAKTGPVTFKTIGGTRVLSFTFSPDPAPSSGFVNAGSLRINAKNAGTINLAYKDTVIKGRGNAIMAITSIRGGTYTILGPTSTPTPTKTPTPTARPSMSVKTLTVRAFNDNNNNGTYEPNAGDTPRTYDITVFVFGAMVYRTRGTYEKIFNVGSTGTYSTDLTPTDQSPNTVLLPPANPKTIIMNNANEVINYIYVKPPTSTGAPSKPSPCNGIGDVNVDNLVNEADALLVLRQMAGLETFDADKIKRADVNSDGTINNLDTLGIRNYVAGNINTFPACTTAPTLCPLKPKGDADCNGKVNIQDFLIWKYEFLNQTPQDGASSFKSNFNGSQGPIDLPDFLAWKSGFLDPTVPHTSGGINLTPN